MGTGPLKPGDVVTLKSGGPKMTVDWTNDEDTACTWFVGSKREQAKFYTATLVKAD